MTKLVFGKDVEKIVKTISREMPALHFTAWDLTPFIPHLHNWRRNIIFIECSRIATTPLSETLAREFPSYDVYVGVRKPKLAINRAEKEASIVIMAREGEKKPAADGAYPSIEKCLVDLLYYSKNEFLPISLPDVLDLWEYYLTRDEPLRFSELYRYAVRKYLGWFVSIFAYELSRKTRLKIDARHDRAGQENLELVRMVQKL